MNRTTTLRRILLTPPGLRSSLLLSRNPLPTYLQTHPNHLTSRQYSSSIQSITQPSFWASLVPKPLRNRSKSKSPSKSPRSKEWNPATFFIFIFLLIGSMSIQMIALRNNFEAFERRSTAKIGLLREIIERIQKGEEVDVEGLLGTGDAKREKEWEEVLQEIEREDQAWEDAQQRRKPTRLSENNNESEKGTNSQPRNTVEQKTEPEKPRSSAPRGFY